MKKRKKLRCFMMISVLLISVFSACMKYEGDLNSQLVQAVGEKDHRQVKRLLKKGADPDTVVRGKDLVLHVAISKNDLESVKLLVNAGADMYSKDADRYFSLLRAAQQGQYEIASFLVEAGIDVNYQSNDWYGLTPIMDAAYSNSTDIIALLLENGADVNALDRFGETALFHAADSDGLEAAKALVVAGIDITVVGVRDGRMINALDRAIDADSPRMVEYLQSLGLEATY